jgi:hypothetical protein
MTPADLKRFHKLCGLLGSEHDGERAAAALKATSWLKEHGLSWADVMVPGVGDPEVDPVEYAHRQQQATSEARQARRKAYSSQWEQNRHQSDVNGFWADMREDIRKATGGEEGTRDPRVRK